MKNRANMAAGDFSDLAENYSLYRPSYSDSVLDALLALVGKPVSEIDFADVGAGTGIWSRLVARRGVKSATTVEPNDEMRKYGIADSEGLSIHWLKGSGENTGLKDGSVDLLTMASSFHWADFDLATKEFARVLRPKGRFAALWNPRLIEANPLLVEIENKLKDFAPNLTRVSSGRSGVTAVLTEKLWASPFFEDVIYIEGRHVAKQTIEHYLGVWWSVNDIRAQAGEKNFLDFMNYVEQRISGLEYIETTYLTRAWCARKA